MNISGRTLIAVILITVGACRSGIEQTGATNTVPLRAVFRDYQCLGDSAGILSIRDADMLMAWWRPLAGRQVPAKPLPQGLQDIDFEVFTLFVVSMGPQPTAGYDIELQDEQAVVHQTLLTIPARWQLPPPDKLVAQVITSPCVALTVPADRYETVRVRDRQGNTLLEVHF